MDTEDTTKRRRLGSPGAEAAAAADVSHDDAMSSLKQRVDLMEASFQREVSEMKRAGTELLAKNSAIESQLSSLQDDNERLKAKVSQLDEENRKLEATFKLNVQGHERILARVSQLDEDTRKLEAAFKTHVENMDWEYDALGPPSDSYWIEQGYDYGNENISDEDYIENINEHFFRTTKEQSELLRRGDYGLQHYTQELNFGNPDEFAPLIRYDRALLSHWIEFRNSMIQWQASSSRLYSIRRISGTIERTQAFSLCLSNIELPVDVLAELRECLFPGGLGHVEELHLMRNEFQGSEGIDFALETMQLQKKITELSYARNPVDNGQDCRRLVDAIVSHPNISRVYLEGLLRGERNGHDFLVDLLRGEGMKSVDFTHCVVKTDGQSTLFDVIKHHPNLMILRLDDNKLDDEDAINLADALRYNRVLCELSLRGNEFTHLGEDVLKKVIYDDSSLNAAADSNHVCTIEGFDSWEESEVYNNASEYDENEQKLNRARKIFDLLEERNKQGTNVHHLEVEMGDDTLKIVPLTLAAVQMYGERRSKQREWNGNNNVTREDAPELSITYELLRSWHVTVFDGHDM